MGGLQGKVAQPHRLDAGDAEEDGVRRARDPERACASLVRVGDIDSLSRFISKIVFLWKHLAIIYVKFSGT